MAKHAEREQVKIINFSIENDIVEHHSHITIKETAMDFYM